MIRPGTRAYVEPLLYAPNLVYRSGLVDFEDCFAPPLHHQAKVGFGVCGLVAWLML